MGILGMPWDRMEIVVMCTVYRSKWKEVGVAVATNCSCSRG